VTIPAAREPEGSARAGSPGRSTAWIGAPAIDAYRRFAPREHDDRPRLLIVGNGGRPTGYGRVLDSLAPHLARVFDVLHFALDHRGAPLDAAVRRLPNMLMGDPFGAAQLPALLDAFRPDLVLVCHDVELSRVYVEVLRVCRGASLRPRLVFYAPIETPAAPPEHALGLADVDHAVAYTHYGRRVIEDACQRAGRTAPPLAAIPHGVDVALFNPLCPDDPGAGRADARAALWPDRPDLRDAFIALNANRNVYRKRVDLTLAAFARFASGKQEVFLALHLGLIDRGCDVRALAGELRIEDRLLLLHDGPEKPSASDERLNLIYNAADVGLNTALGEAWGLVAFEHAATGAAQIVPAHGAATELWGDIGLLAPLDPTPDAPGRVSIDGVAAALNALYADPALRREYSRRACAHATQARFGWSAIAREWIALLEGALER
jgi:D-inositol-3-phosphate glycosyltransferase